jgi:hypothetical protein
MAEKSLTSSSQKPGSINPVIMQLQLDAARNSNRQSLNQIIKQRTGNQAELDKVKQQQFRARKENNESLNRANLYRQNQQPRPETEGFNNEQQEPENRSLNQGSSPLPNPLDIERMLNMGRQNKKNQPDQPENEADLDPIEADEGQSASGREDRIGGLRDKGRAGKAEATAEMSPRDQEAKLTENRQPPAMNIPGIGGPSGGMSADALKEVGTEAAKKVAKMEAKKVIISVLLWASPWILTGLALGMLLALIILPTIMVYDCTSKMGLAQKASFGWSVFWSDYEGALKKAMSADCFPESTPAPETTRTKEDPPQTAPPPETTE